MIQFLPYCNAKGQRLTAEQVNTCKSRAGHKYLRMTQISKKHQISPPWLKFALQNLNSAL